MPKKAKKSLAKRLSFPSLVTGVRSKNKKAIRQFEELFLIEWSPPPPEAVIRVPDLSVFLRMARKGEESEAARLLNEIVRDCPPSRRDTNDVVVIDYNLCQQFKDFYSKEFTSLGLVLAGVWSDQTDLQLLATKKFRKVLLDTLCPAEPPFILEYDIVPRFEEFLERKDFPDLQTEAALALKDICSVASMYIEVGTYFDSVKVLLKLLDSSSSDVRDKAVLELGNVAETREGRDRVHQHEAVRPMLDKVLRPLLDELDKNDKLLPKLRNATYTLLRFYKGEDDPGEYEVEVTENKYGKFTAFKKIVMVSSHLDKVRITISELSRLVGLTDEEVLTNACSVLACLTDSTYCKTRVVIGNDVCRQLVKLLEHQSPSVVTPAVRTLKNIVLREDIQSQRIVEFGALPCLWKLLSKNIKEIDVWTTIRSLTKGNDWWIKENQIESTNSQFQDSMWHEIEEKKEEVKEKLEQYAEVKLGHLCVQLSIPVCQRTARKMDMVPELMDFLEGLRATTAELHAEKEQSSKGKKRRRESEQEKDANEEEPEEETANDVPDRSAGKMSELGPNDEDLCRAIGEILRQVDIATTDFTNIMERLGKRFGTDLTSRETHIRIMIRYQFTRLLSDNVDWDEHT